MEALFKLHNGAITLFIDGQPYPFTTYKSTEMPNDKLFEETVRRSVAGLAARGVHVHFVPIFFDWPAPGQYDFARMDWRVGRVLAADPQAWVVIRIQAASMAPEWWMEANPDGVLKFGFGRGVELPRPRFQTGPAPSLGSNFWEEAGLPTLRALAEHVKAQPYAGRVIGYLPTAYNSNEWFFRSTNPLHVSDLCPAMEKAFSHWLKENYGMQEDHRVPDRADRHLADRGYLFDPDPRRSRAPVAAYHRFVNELCAETIVKATQVLRQVHTPDRIIVGTFYGYLLELAQFPWLAESGTWPWGACSRRTAPISPAARWCTSPATHTSCPAAVGPGRSARRSIRPDRPAKPTSARTTSGPRMASACPPGSAPAAPPRMWPCSGITSASPCARARTSGGTTWLGIITIRPCGWMCSKSARRLLTKPWTATAPPLPKSRW